MDWGSFVGGLVLGGIVVGLLVTSTGREVTARVGRATGERLAYHIKPRS
jgi:hypothetical protein